MVTNINELNEGMIQFVVLIEIFNQFFLLLL
jgi:hypothetical protein